MIIGLTPPATDKTIGTDATDGADLGRFSGGGAAGDPVSGGGKRAGGADGDYL